MNKVKAYKYDTSWIKGLSQEEIITIKKIMSQMENRLIDESDECLICHKKVTSFCHSHSIPQFVLKNISNTFYDGQSYLLNGLVPKSGVKNTLLFRNICDDCDNTKFQEYEDPKKLEANINADTLKQIAMKNILYGIYVKRKIIKICEKEIDDIMNEIISLEQTVSNLPRLRILAKKLKTNMEELEVSKLDLNELMDDFGKKDLSYKIIFSKKLDYMAKIACQTSANIISDLSGKIINNVYDKRAENRMEALHICVFPFNGITRIILFTDNRNSKYDRMKNQLDRHVKDWKSIINYMILLYCEGWAISSSFDINSEEAKEISNLIATHQNIISSTNNIDEIIKKACIEYKLIPNRKIYNFLEK